jgi:two-component system KDP operon response regulator KdpE
MSDFSNILLGLPRIIRLKEKAPELDYSSFRLLAALARGHGKVLTHRQLLLEVWGPSYVYRPHYLHVYMANLRQKLEEEPTRPKHIITELQVGYRLACLSDGP